MNKRLINNAIWIVVCKLIQAVVALIIGMITARYLGPSQYGLISYAASIVAFFLPIVKLGFNATLVREFINTPDETNKILGTAIIFSIVAALVSIIGIVSFTMLANAGERETVTVCFLYSLILIFQACEMPQYWFQSQLLSKYSSVVSLVSYIFVSVYKICILVFQKNIYWFAIVHVIESAISSLVLIILYKKISEKKLSYSYSIGKKLLKSSKYYIVSGLMTVICQQTDRIMLKLMVGEVETGLYSASLTCISVTAFVFAAIIDSARPLVLEKHHTSSAAFYRSMILLYAVITYLAIAQGVIMTVLSKVLIYIMYGVEYSMAANILPIVVWYSLLDYYGMVRNIWMIAENKQKYLILINSVGALINIVMNYLFIPIWGARGAAFASVITLGFINFVFCFIIKAIRPVGKLIIGSFNPKVIISIIKTIKSG